MNNFDIDNKLNHTSKNGSYIILYDYQQTREVLVLKHS